MSRYCIETASECPLWECYGCEQKFSAEPRFDAHDHMFGPCCAQFAEPESDDEPSDAERWLAEGAAAYDAAVAKIEAAAATPWVAECKPHGCRNWRERDDVVQGHATATEAMQTRAGKTRYRNERVRNTVTGEIVSLEQNARGTA